MVESTLAIIEEWKRKSSELAVQRKDALFTAATRGFEAMAAMLNKESEQEDIQRALVYLNAERSLSFQFEKLKDDSTRDIMHGILESLHLTLTELIKERNDILELIAQLNDVNATIPISPMEGVRNAFDVSWANIDNNEVHNFDLGDEVKEEIKEEVMDDDLEVEMHDSRNAIENPFNDDFSLARNEPADMTMPPSDFMNDDMPYDDDVHMEDTDQIANSEVEHPDSAADGPDEEDGMKPIKIFGKQSVHDKEPQLPKRSKTEMECPECEFRTYSVYSWRKHLNSKHSTTPARAGLVLLCECGYESLSERHSRMCIIANFTVVRKGDGPIRKLGDGSIRRVDERKTTPQCILCDKRPSTAYGYATHLNKCHNSSLLANDIYLLCACGDKFTNYSANVYAGHKNKCDSLDFTVHKLYDE